MNKILILGRDPIIYANLAVSLTDAKTTVDVASFTDLAFLIEDAEASITLYSTGIDLRDYQKILVLSTSLGHERNYIFSALACYCRRHQVQILDDSFTNTDGKLYAMWRFWEQGVAVPKTAFGPTEFLVDILPQFNNIAVLKSVKGTKGNDNYLVKTAAEIRQITAENPGIDFILQNFIPNDGDYRIVLMNFEPQLVIYRSANGKDFRNNTSLGGQATLIPIEQLDTSIVQIAITAAKALDIKIAGADIIMNKNTHEYSVLEINRTPQLATGAFPEAKVAALKRLISQ